MMGAGEGVNPPAHPRGRGLCRPDACGSTAQQPSWSSLQQGNLGRCGAELYLFKLCEKCPFCSCWRTTLITLHYLLTFQGAPGAPLLVGSAPNAPSLLWTGAGCLRARLPPNMLFTCCQLNVRSKQKPCRAGEDSSTYLSGLASVHPSSLFLAARGAVGP